MKNYWKALLVLDISALVYRLVAEWLPGGWNWLLTILWSFLMLLFGYFLTPQRKRNNRWFGKTLLSIVILFIVSYRLNILHIDQINNILSFIGFNGFFLDCLLIYCGWAFFQV